MAAADADRAFAAPAGLVPAGTTELGIDIIKVDRIRAALDRFGARFSSRVLTDAEQRYVRDRPETMAGRWAAKEAVSQGPRARRPRDRLARHRDRAAADRPARGPAPRPRGRPRRAARDGPDRGLDHPRVGLRGRDRVRGPDGRRPLRLPARHRGPPRRARAAHPRPDRAPAGDRGGRWRRGARVRCPPAAPAGRSRA